ncbi:arf sar family protein [Phaffia rhodozyma]|uniref:Arf sar family protein n=1 Tax=Phaffia rhodozyma TaxID=264483 RepID=A0A0F7SSV5_PHARH|nr:arf sar family protein [Phaffia rhodozyma]
MGLAFSSLWDKLFGLAEIKVLILGLDNAGKTTILYKISLGEVVATAPTVGSNQETYVYKNLKFNLWDIGGQSSLRQSWSSYYSKTQAVILVVDSTDRARLGLVRDELARMVGDENLRDSLLLILANKQDVPNCLTAAVISDTLGLTNLKDREWQIVPTSALTGKGLTEGFDWLATKLGGTSRS